MLVTTKVLTQSSAREVLEALGDHYEVTCEGRPAMVCLPTKEGIKRVLGDTPGNIFKRYWVRTEYKTQQGILVDINFYQVKAILQEISKQQPKIGLSNLRGSRKVHEVLNKACVYNEKEIYAFWTGEKYVGYGDESKYSPEGFIMVSELNILSNTRFCDRGIFDDGWFDLDPSSHFDLRAVVLGSLV
jgi:hypothetical protein